MPNLYNKPPEGYTIIDSEDQAGSWEFDMILFVREDATGQIRCFTDSGCSCYSPFEYVTWDEGDVVRNADDAEYLIASWWDRDKHASLGDIVTMRRTVIAAL